jgi:predicted O-methyltransferase YrrM
MSYNPGKYKSSNDWFIKSELRRVIRNYIGTIDAKRAILEIGSFEGMSACYFSDVLLDHPESTLDCVDPWDLSDTTTYLQKSTEDIFNENIQKSAQVTKIVTHKMYSNFFFDNVNQQREYDLIYIDGSHVYEHVYNDIVMCDRVLKPGGIMWIDDFAAESVGVNKAARELFNGDLKDKYEIIHQGWQLGLRKRRNV